MVCVFQIAYLEFVKGRCDLIRHSGKEPWKLIIRMTVVYPFYILCFAIDLEFLRTVDC